MLVGDALSEQVADALREAKVVIVVVSPTSVQSKWLKYELNLATDRMIKGRCRVIPVIIGTAILPTVVEGLLYADFRKGFKLGAGKVITALQYEAAQESARQAVSAPLYARVDKVVESVFGRIGSVSAFGEYKSTDWQCVSVPVPSAQDPDETSIYYDFVGSYGPSKKPLIQAWLDEFHESYAQTGEKFALIVTTRPIGFKVKRPDATMPQVSYRELNGSEVGEVFVELDADSEEHWRILLERTQALLIQTVLRRNQL